jgi:Flp pilus assembly protein TadG
MKKTYASQSLHYKSKRMGQSENGQTVVEFALVSILFIFLLVVTFNGILAFGTQQYFSYVAFMSARAYQAAGATPETQVQAARQTLAAYIPNLNASMINQNLGEPGLRIQFDTFGQRPIAFVKRIVVPDAVIGSYSSVEGLDRDAGNQAQNPALPGSLPVAIQIEFKVPFATMPLGKEAAEKIGYITMYAQSYLGRQVTKSECRQFFSGFLEKFLVPNRSFQFPQYMEDNGC